MTTPQPFMPQVKCGECGGTGSVQVAYRVVEAVPDRLGNPEPREGVRYDVEGCSACNGSGLTPAPLQPRDEREGGEVPVDEMTREMVRTERALEQARAAIVDGANRRETELLIHFYTVEFEEAVRADERARLATEYRESVLRKVLEGPSQ